MKNIKCKIASIKCFPYFSTGGPFLWKLKQASKQTSKQKHRKKMLKGFRLSKIEKNIIADGKNVVFFKKALCEGQATYYKFSINFIQLYLSCTYNRRIYVTWRLCPKPAEF